MLRKPRLYRGRPCQSLPVYSVSLGCPKNRVDTEHCLGSLGVRIVPTQNPSQARLILINTCAFIESAVKESLQTLFAVCTEIQDQPRKPLLVVCGCLPGRYGKQALEKDIPEVDLWLEPKEIEQWPLLIAKHLQLQKSPKPGRLRSTAPSYAWLKIADGCRHKCSFCTIPAIRGSYVSSPLDAILQEAKELVADGVLELDLVAQDVTGWGKDCGKSLLDLLPKLAELPNLLWLRLLYCYPTGVNDALLALIKSVGQPLLPYFDIPLQHADPNILASMGRPFAKDPRILINHIHDRLPEAILRTTVIVGYPGETDEAFEKLYRFVEEGHFLHLGVFCYEAEEGTVAATLPNQVPKEQARQRREALMSLQQAISREYLQRFLGETQTILVDAVHPEWPGLYTGRSWFQAPEVDGVTYVSGKAKVGQACVGEIVDTMDYDLSALVCE
ncbi:MAG: 30S ribosomal protein S12 methylthiotransferase RimO [Desulfovibrio sp.]|nr:30S ribosomal protein S12 methylthiotransferase RimO [Desulfovibrio sp.]